MCIRDSTYAAAIIAGLVVGIAIGKITEVYTSSDFKSVKKIADQSQTGPATTIISGLGVGMMSTLWPIILICIGVFVAYPVSYTHLHSHQGLCRRIGLPELWPIPRYFSI